MGTAPQDLLNIYWLGRQIAWRYKLDAYDNEVLKRIQASLATARREIQLKFEAQLLRTDWSASRAEEVLYALDELTQGVRLTMADQIGEAAGFAGQHSLAEHSDILSVGGAAVNVSFVSLSAEQIRQMFVDTPLGGKTLSAWVDAAFDTTVKDGIKEELNVGMLQGEGYPKLVKRLSQGFDMLSKEQATTLARTYVQSANVAAMEAVYKQNADVVKRVKWRATLEPGYKNTGHGTCLRCSALDGRTWALDDTSRPNCPLHPRCLTGETPVFAPNKIAAFVAPYSGPVVDIGLSDGRRFAVTPNHLFLTRDGFTAAQALREGTDIFDSPEAQRKIFADPHDDRNPSAIQKVVEAFAKTPGMGTIRVPHATEHLHGDGEFANGYIDIIAPDSLLRGDREAFARKYGRKLDLLRPDVPLVPLPAESNFLGPLFWLRFASGGFMRGLSVAEVFLGASASHHQAVSLGAVANGYTGGQEAGANCGPANAKALSNFVFRDPGQIQGSHLFKRDVQPSFGNCLWLPSIGTNTVPFENGRDAGNRNSVVLRNFSRRFSGSITSAYVSFTRVRYFTGHVYDLQTASSLYYVGGLLSSNCRCVTTPETISWRDLGIPLDELQDAARPYTMRPDKTIGVGGAREIEEYGFHQGDYGSWFEKQSDAFKLNAVGPGRLDMLKSGKVTFGELVDGKGKLLTLEELNRVHGN
jgi:hypothetical protein